jgi:type II secretory pathway component PulL
MDGEAINEVVIAWLIIEEVVADAQKVLHLSVPGEASAAFVVVVGVEEVGVGACLGRR